MTTINFFKANTININVDFPTTWNELTLADLLYISNVIWQPTTTKQQILLKLIQFRVGNKFHLELLNLEQLVTEGLPLIEFIHKSIELTKFPFQNHKHIPNLANDFADMICGIYEECETEFIRFTQTKEEKHLHNFVKHLINVDHAKLSEAEIKLLFLWYTGCRNQLPKYFAHLYRSSQSSTTQATGMEFTTIVHLGAGERNGLRENIRKYKLHEFLYDMDLEAKRNYETKESLENG